MDILSALTRPKLLALKIPTDCEVATADGDIDAVERDGLQARRAAAGAAAAARNAGNGSAGAASAAASAASGVNSDDDDLADSDDDESSVVVRVQTIDVASSIGGKIWDVSLLLGAWLAADRARVPPPPADGGGRRPRVLELGAGLGISGLAAALAHPHLHVTLSDYDDAVNANLHESIRLTAASARVDVEKVDFRDFADGAAPPQYAPLVRAFDLIIGADVVYELSHANIARVVAALLADAPAGGGGWRPRAYFMLLDGRPRLREFVAAFETVGAACRIERLRPTAELARRLRRAHDGWAAGGATFSLYSVVRV